MKYDGMYCIVRCDRAGVFAGYVERAEGREVILSECRRLWYWEGAASLSQLAVDGVKRPNGCKFTVTVPEMAVLDAIEIIPCTVEAASCIKAVPEWKM